MAVVAGITILARPHCWAGGTESKAGGSAWEDSDGALGRKALAAAATAVLAGLAF